jgi:hypothetical protein
MPENPYPPNTLAYDVEDARLAGREFVGRLRTWCEDLVRGLRAGWKLR